MGEQGANSRRKHRVVMIDDHPLLRHGMGQLIGLEKDLEVVGEADTAEQGLRLLSAGNVDLAIVDISLTDGSGIELIKAIRARHPSTVVLVVSMHDEVVYAERALRAGARGYLMKHEAPKRIVRAISEVLSGGIALSDAMRVRLLERYTHTPGGIPANPLDVLTDRELEVFRLIGEGLKKSEIARRIRRSVNTVEAHRTSIKRKLNLKSGTELARVAYQSLEESRR